MSIQVFERTQRWCLRFHSKHRGLDDLEEEVEILLRSGSWIQRHITYGMRQTGRDLLLDRLQLTTKEDAVVDDEDISRGVEKPIHSGGIAWTGLENPSLEQSLDVRHRQVQVQREQACGEQSTPWMPTINSTSLVAEEATTSSSRSATLRYLMRCSTP
jgi:hypothetical protein